MEQETGIRQNPGREALRISREHLRALLEESPVAVYLTDDSGDCVYVNRKWREMSGLSEEEARGKGWISGLHPDDRAEIGEKWYRSVETNGEWSFEYRFQNKEGKTTWVLGNAAAVRNGDGNLIAYVGTNVDITERKRAEAALKESEERFRGVFDNSPMGMAVVTVEDQRLIEVNKSFLEIVGYSEEEVLSMTVADLTHPDDWERERKEVRESLNGPLGRFDLDKRYIRKDGSIRWVNLTGCLLTSRSGEKLAIANVFDITDQKRLEESLRESEARYRGYFDLGLIGMAITSVDKGWVQFNDRLCEILQYPREELARMTWAQLTHPDDLAADEAQFERVLRGEIDGYSLEKRFIRKDGSVVHASISAKCVRRPDGSADHFVAMVQDISERVQMDEEKRRFYRDTIRNVTQGKLNLVSSEEVREYLDSAILEREIASAVDTVSARHELTRFCFENRLAGDRLDLLETAAGEAMANGIKHANGCRLSAGVRDGAVWVAVSDRGPGIPALTLPDATLQRGFSTKTSMGMGYTIMLEASDRLMLCTGPEGTTVVLEVEVTTSRRPLSLDDIPDTWGTIAGS
jgi:PAS domain S-box-containing protein